MVSKIISYFGSTLQEVEVKSKVTASCIYNFTSFVPVMFFLRRSVSILAAGTVKR